MSDCIHDVIMRTIENLDKLKQASQNTQNQNDVLKTDFRMLEFYSGELCVLSSKPGMGKSAFVLSLIKQLAIDKKRSVGFINPGSFDDITFGKRLLSMCSGVDTAKIRVGMLNPSDVNKVEATAKKLYDSTIEYFNEPNCSYSSTEEAIKNMVNKHHTKLIIVEGFDFLQELVDAEKEDYRDTLEHLLWSFNCLATELAVAIMLVIDLPEPVSDILSEPSLLDFKKYMIIPTFANKVVFVHRDRLCRTKTPFKDAQLIIAKNEFGPTGETSMKFDNRTCLFFEEKM